GLVLLLGEAGVGKTRLAEELAELAAAEHGAAVIEGRCVPYGEANVWWPLAEAVRQACGIGPADPAETVAAKTRATIAAAIDRLPDSAEVTRAADALNYLLGEPAALVDVEPARAREEA